ncbi:MAG TPA: hypothetical protein VGN00_00930 [Puia sp.]|jgi:hypothetical protein
MINRVFFITAPEAVNNTAISSEENVYECVAVNPLTEGALQRTYRLIENSNRPLVLALECRSILTADAIRYLAAFCFMPFYQRIYDRPVIVLSGDQEISLEPARASALNIRHYLEEAGLKAPIIHCLPHGQMFRSVGGLSAYYSDLLKTDNFYDNDLFFYAADLASLQSALAALQQVENAMEQHSPRLLDLVRIHLRQKEQLDTLERKKFRMEAELANQQQYLQILRSGHQAKEIQDYYTREYESLPLWFKRIGHIVKVLTGKRTFRSLFRSDVKKYKD